MVISLVSVASPEDAAGPHADWVATGDALNDIFQNTNAELAGLNEAPDVNAYLSGLPLQALQSAYRDACESIAELSQQSDGPTGEIVCQPPQDDGA